MTERRKKKRTAPISIRPPEGDRDEFMAIVQSSGMPVSAFVTAAVLGRAMPRRLSPSVSLDRQTLGLLLAQAAKIVERLNQMQPRQTDTASIRLMEDCHSELVEIRTCLMLALGRSP